MSQFPPLAIVIPAAGVGSRMQADKAKQYLSINNKTVLEHTIEKFLNLDFVNAIYVVVSETDEYFDNLVISTAGKIRKVVGGKERADSVLNGISLAIEDNCCWIMVHDAARPCVTEKDIRNLYQTCLEQNTAAILATPVRDTMKRSGSGSALIAETVDRTAMWHALTPQCANAKELQAALLKQVETQTGNVGNLITDEASALELAGSPVALVQGSVKNIKITMPEDLELAEFYLSGRK